MKGEKVDLVLDSIGPATFLKYFDILNPNGRIVNFGASSGDTIEIPLRALFTRKSALWEHLWGVGKNLIV